MKDLKNLEEMILGCSLTMTEALTLDLWLVKDNRFLNPKSSYERILTAPPCRLIVSCCLWKLLGIQMRSLVQEVLEKFTKEISSPA